METEISKKGKNYLELNEKLFLLYESNKDYSELFNNITQLINNYLKENEKEEEQKNNDEQQSNEIQQEKNEVIMNTLVIDDDTFCCLWISPNKTASNNDKSIINEDVLIVCPLYNFEILYRSMMTMSIFNFLIFLLLESIPITLIFLELKNEANDNPTKPNPIIVTFFMFISVAWLNKFCLIKALCFYD